jgi:hypothetical protein
MNYKNKLQKFQLMNFLKIKTFYGLMLCMIAFLSQSTYGQQFSSDNYLPKPHGMATIILTTGQRNTMVMNTFSLFPRWEFTGAVYIYRNDNDRLTDDGYSLSVYAKYMIYENKAQTGGFAVKAGKGLDPGYQDGEDMITEASETYWMNAPVTIPFLKNKFSWDLMPGASMTLKYGENDETAWAFTYTTRLAYYPFNPKLALVGEVFGSKGEVQSHPEYRTGIRWEPSQYANFAFTYGGKFNGSNGAGWEFGIMLFTPRFACLKGCK